MGGYTPLKTIMTALVGMDPISRIERTTDMGFSDLACACTGSMLGVLCCLWCIVQGCLVGWQDRCTKQRVAIGQTVLR